MATAGISRICRSILLTITIFSLSLPAYAKYSGGIGEPNDPYQIATAEDLMLLGETPDDYDKHFVLTADIDLDPNLPGRKVFDKAVICNFIGVFEGNGHTISHLTINGDGALGLFGQLGNFRSGGEVKNLGMVDVRISGSGDEVGGLVGLSRGEITNCYSTGTVSGDSSVGGLVGINLVSWHRIFFGTDYSCGLIAQCYSTGAVTGTKDVGGLVGANPGDVVNCYSTSAVTGDSSIGGLVGANLEWLSVPGTEITVDGLISKCYSTGAVIGNSDVGGLVGERIYDYYWRDSGVIYSFWDIETSGQNASAGGKGLTTSAMQTSHTFSLWGTCGNEGIWTIDEGNNYPKLAWENQPGEAIHLSPLTDLLLGTGTESDPFLISTAEELYQIGLFPCEWEKNFRLMADVDLSGFDGKEGRRAFNVIGNNIEAFSGCFNGNGHTVSHLTIVGDDFLGLFGYSSGEIKDLGVVDVNITGLDKSFIGGLVGYNCFYGAVLRCYAAGVVSGGMRVGGLVGSNSGYVTGCDSAGVVNGRLAIGGLVGEQFDWVDNPVFYGTSPDAATMILFDPTFYGHITGCCSSATVTGETCVGGLVGSNWWSITASYSTGAISGNEEVGGLLGSNCGYVTNCYSTGSANGDWEVGGLVGSNFYGSIATSYSTGPVSGHFDVGGLVGRYGTVTVSFWDTQTSGWTWSLWGTGKTTAEMQTAKTFLDAGWDFVDETENGTDNIWWILEGQDYPRLWWEWIREN